MTRIRHLLLLTALAILLAPSVLASDFRGFDWGASKQEIRKAEKLPLHHDLPEEVAYWNFKLAGVDAGLIYQFEDGRLVRAYYLSRHRTRKLQEDYEDYLAFQRHFDQELGQHVEEEWVWADGGSHPKSEETLEALAAGRAKIVTRWEHESNRVRMVIDAKEETLRIYFEPKAGR